MKNAPLWLENYSVPFYSSDNPDAPS